MGGPSIAQNLSSIISGLAGTYLNVWYQGLRVMIGVGSGIARDDRPDPAYYCLVFNQDHSGL